MSDPVGQVLFETERVIVFRSPNPEAETHVVVQAKGPRSLLELAAKGTDRDISETFRALSEAQRRLGIEGGRVRVDSSSGAPTLQIHLLAGLPAPIAVPPDRAESAIAVFLQPLAEEATPAQVSAVANSLDVEAYDARRLLATPVPRILDCGPAQRLRPMSARLVEVGIPLGCVETNILLADLDPWVVEWLEVEEDGLYMVGTEGRVRLRVDRSALLVRGRYGVLPGAALKGGAQIRKASATLPRLRSANFAQLYLRGSARPFSFVESEIRDYAFLAEDMRPSASANFEALVEIIASAPEVRTETRLLGQDPVAVSGAVSKLWSVAKKPECDSPDINVEVLSRLFYFSTF